MVTPPDEEMRRLRREVDELTGICVAQDLVLHELVVAVRRAGLFAPEALSALRQVAPQVRGASALRKTVSDHLASLLDDAAEDD